MKVQQQFVICAIQCSLFSLLSFPFRFKVEVAVDLDSHDEREGKENSKLLARSLARSAGRLLLSSDARCEKARTKVGGRR